MNGRRLYRSEQDKMLFGVSGGLADYFDIDVSLVRLGWVLLCIVSGGLLAIAYLLMGLVTPTYFQLYGVEEDEIGTDEEESAGDAEGEDEGGEEDDSGVQAARKEGRIGREERRRARRHRRRISLGRTGGAGMFFGLVLVVVGGIALMGTLNIFDWIPWGQIWPVVVIGFGAMILWKRRDR